MSKVGKPKRSRSKTISAEVVAFKAVAAGPIPPPATAKLRDADLPLWDAIIGVRAREEWTKVDLQHAANLARCMADIERISDEVQTEGDVLENARGTMVANPKHGLIEILSRRSVMLCRILGLHAAVLQGRPRDTGEARKSELLAHRTAEDADDSDGLLATPVLQ